MQISQINQAVKTYATCYTLTYKKFLVSYIETEVMQKRPVMPSLR